MMTGAILKGDQLMMVDGKSMVDISLKSAQDILKEAMTNMDVSFDFYSLYSHV